MTIFLGIVSAALLAGSLGLLWVWRRFRQEIALMAATATSRAADVAALAPGSAVEVKGTIRCETPIKGGFSERACVYCRTLVERKETRWQDGKREESWVTETSNETRTLFEVDDGSGRVRVDSQGAAVEAILSHEREEAGGLLGIVADLAGARSSGARRFREHILPPDIPVYVLGWVQPGGTIGAAPDGAPSRTFVVTHESEEEHSRSSFRWMIASLIGAILLLAGAVFALYAAFLPG